jgi:hypothetical protein
MNRWMLFVGGISQVGYFGLNIEIGLLGLGLPIGMAIEDLPLVCHWIKALNEGRQYEIKILTIKLNH